MLTTTNKMADKLDALAESLESKIESLDRDRAMRTPKQRKQASYTRYEKHNLESARDAMVALANGHRNGTIPSSLLGYKTISGISEATKVRMTGGTGYYSEVYPDHGNYYDTSPEAVALRAFVSGAVNDEEIAKRKASQELELKLSQARSIDIPGFFPTPDNIIGMMVFGMGLSGATVLEPSAGIGSIADVARDMGATVVCIERLHSLCEILEAKGHNTICDDFLNYTPAPLFDFVLMNPPFEKNQDIEHVMHAARFLVPGGTIKAIMPSSAMRHGESGQKKRQEFAAWVDQHSSYWTSLPDGSFKNAFRSTGVNCAMLTLTV